MLEAKLEKAELLKKVLDAVKEIVQDANFDCSDEGINLQAMDNAHVALTSLHLPPSIFVENGYRCDRTMSLGMNLGSLLKIVRCAGNDDEVTIRADESADSLIMQFNDKVHDRHGEYEMKLMDIDQEHMGVPDTDYDAHLTMPSAEFAKIVRDLKELGESVRIEITKEGVTFTAEGDVGKAAVVVRPTSGSAKKKVGSTSKNAKSRADDEDRMDEDARTNGHTKVKDEEDETPVHGDDDDENDDDDDGPSRGKGKKSRVADDEDEEDENDDDDDDDRGDRKRKADGKKTNGKASSKRRKGEDVDRGEDSRRVVITLTQSVDLTFSVKYLNNFAKSTPLSPEVTLSMSKEVPLLVKYQFGDGNISYYLAPKISDEDEDEDN